MQCQWRVGRVVQCRKIGAIKVQNKQEVSVVTLFPAHSFWVASNSSTHSICSVFGLHILKIAALNWVAKPVFNIRKYMYIERVADHNIKLFFFGLHGCRLNVWNLIHVVFVSKILIRTRKIPDCSYIPYSEILDCFVFPGRNENPVHVSVRANCLVRDNQTLAAVG